MQKRERGRRWWRRRSTQIRNNSNILSKNMYFYLELRVACCSTEDDTCTQHFDENRSRKTELGLVWSGLVWALPHTRSDPKLAQHAVYYKVVLCAHGFSYVMQINLMKLITLKNMFSERLGQAGKQARDVHSPSTGRLHVLQTDASNMPIQLQWSHTDLANRGTYSNNFEWIFPN
jgi:hypothetical protein